MPGNLDALMTFGHIVRSDGNGNATDELETTEYVPDIVYVELDPDGQISYPLNIDMVGYGDWSLLRGWTSQALSRPDDPIMHNSEFIGGKLEIFIRETSGLYVAVMVDAWAEDEDGENIPVGWAVAYKESSGP
ncbi:hypothetical protein [Nocardia terpenica]|nr:hypothetical protein [Nocardia terpenica]NQE89764.1 hypothetical protein [Nocardia terpenica]